MKYFLLLQGSQYTSLECTLSLILPQENLKLYIKYMASMGCKMMVKEELKTMIAGLVTYSGITATFSPAVDLARNTSYTGTITMGAKDSAGML